MALVASVLAMLVPVLVPAAQAAPLPSRIVGYAETPGGALLEDIIVEVYSSYDSVPVATAVTNSSGEYAIDLTNTPPGGDGYTVTFTDPDDSLGFLAFGSVYIQPGYDEIIGVKMRPGGRVQGTVTNEGGGPATGVCVDVVTYYYGISPALPGSTQDCDLTDGYVSPALATGSYDVRVTDVDGEYVSAQYAEVVAPATVFRDVVLPAPTGTARVSGQILAPGGVAVAGCVNVLDDNLSFVASGCTDQTLTYRTDFFDPGTYTFSAYTFSSIYAVAPASDVVVAAGDQTVDLTATKKATIEGTVTAPGGAPIAGAQVRVCAVSSPSSCNFAQASTSTDGTYIVNAAGLVGETVAVAFTGPNLVWEWHNNIVFSAGDGFVPPPGVTTVVPVADTATTVNAELNSIAPSQISGTITDSATGLPIAGVAVTLGQPSTFFTSWFTGTTTDVNGNYAIGNLEAGSYFVRAATFGYQSERYENLINGPGDPTLVTVAPSESVTGIDFDLDPQGVIEGRVTTDLDPISPYATDFCVTATPDSGLFSPLSTCRLLGTTYRFSKLPSGTYTLEFTSDDYATKTITGVVVTTPAKTTVPDTQLELLAVLSGTVTDNATPANPVEGFVCTENVDYLLVRCGQTAADGTYAFTVRPGTLGVRAEATGYFSEWYLNSSTAPGTPIVVGDADVSGINFTLERQPAITGRVTFDGEGVCFAQVSLLDAADDGLVTSGYTSCATGATGGTYTIYTSPGDYKVRFSSFNNAYQTQYWDSKADIALADVIQLDAGEVESNVNAVLVESPKITGVVTEDGTGDAIANVTVSAYTAGGLFAGGTSTNVNGEYALTLQPGTYDVSFTRTGYRTEWFNDQPNQDSATSVVLGASGAVASASLFPLRSISGIVTADGTGLPLAGIRVEAIVPSTTFASASVFTDNTGAYELFVEAGTWLLRFDGRLSNRVVEYYDDAPTLGEATLVDATVSNPTNINAALELGGTISGSVVGSLGTAGACVYAHDSAPSWPYSTQFSACGFGTYTLRGLPAGTYRLFADSYIEEDADEWFDGAGSYAGGIDLVVTAGASTSANLTLDPAGQPISGRVVDVLGVGIDGVAVSLSSGPTVQTAGGGYFTVTAPDDDFLENAVSFSKDGYVSEYYNDSQFSYSPVVTFGFPVDLGEIELAAAPVTVSGTITEMDSSGVPAVPVCVTFQPFEDTGFSEFNYGLSYRTCADDLGNYSVALPEGDFTVQVYGETYPSPFISTYPFDTSTPFSPIAPSETLNLEIQRGSVFTGRVVQEGTSLGLPSVSVEITKVGDFYSTGFGFTDQLGFIKTTGVVDGEYSVRFVNSVGRYISAYLGGSLTSPGTTVMVSGGDVNLGTVELSLGSLITGTLTDESDNPVEGCVTVYAAGTSESVTSGCADSNGAYATAGLPDGTYDATASAFGYDDVTVEVMISGGDVVQNFVLSAPVPLGPVQDLVATPGFEKVTLNWSPPVDVGAGVVDYDVYIDEGFGLYFSGSTSGVESYTVEFLTNGTLYEFVVVARDALGAEAWSDPASATPSAQPPGQPTGVMAVAGAGQVTVSWTAPDDGGSPLIDSRVQVLKSGSWVWGATALAPSTSGTVKGLDGGTEYSFRVRTLNAEGWGPWSAVVTATPTAQPAVPPTVVQSVTTTPGTGEVSVSWNAPASDGGSAIIDTRVQVFKDGAWRHGATAIGAATSATVQSLTGGVEYQFRVRTQNVAGWSPWSAIVFETPTAATISAPGAIEDLVGFGAFAEGEVDVYWNNPTDDGGEAVFDTRVQVFKGGRWVWGATALGGATSATVGSLNPGETYSFRARTRNSAGWGPWSLVAVADATATVGVG